MTDRRIIAIATVFLTCVSFSRANDENEKQQKHHKVWDLLSMVSGDERAKLRAAKVEAMKDPAVQAAHERRKQADAEYRELLHREMLKTDPSLKPLLDKLAELKQRDDF